jgi:hypothetical protein
MVARSGRVIKKNLLLVRYSFERLGKSFKCGELQRGWGEKVTIRKTRSETDVCEGQAGPSGLLPVARNPSRINAKRGDRFLQAAFSLPILIAA